MVSLHVCFACVLCERAIALTCITNAKRANYRYRYIYLFVLTGELSLSFRGPNCACMILFLDRKLKRVCHRLCSAADLQLSTLNASRVCVRVYVCTQCTGYVCVCVCVCVFVCVCACYHVLELLAAAKRRPLRPWPTSLPP